MNVGATEFVSDAGAFTVVNVANDDLGAFFSESARRGQADP